MVGLVHQDPGIGLTAGEVFAGYTILRLLGSGGMGEVYLAKHPRLPRHEALKVLGAGVCADDDYRRRFIREADVAAALWHPNIVRVNDRGEHAGGLWISMDYVEGTDAASLLRDHYPVGMPADQVSTIIAAIASALDYAHQHHDLLHRDVSPANILLSDPGEDGQRILLGDFGIARNIGDASGLTATNMTIGTFPYAAPEQLTDEPIDGRADQYALAATVYHLLTGTTLFPHTNPAVVISRHLSTPPPALAQTRPELAAFDPVLAVALAKNPADRYARCTDFAHAFARAARCGRHPKSSASTMPAPLASRPAKATPAPRTLADRETPQRRGRWRIFAAASTVLALTAVGASGYSISNDTTASAHRTLAASPEQGPPPSPTQPVAQHPPPPRPTPPVPAPHRVAPPPQRPAETQIISAPKVSRIPAPVVTPPAPPHPPSPDQSFLSLVSEIPGITVTDPATAAATGRAVCTSLQNGGTPHDAAAATVNNTGITPAQASAGINAAITAYCPQYQG
ncbi:Serine/threonine-protein kinase PknF [Mycobacterium marinum]|uniref:serine/threonine-protein kinase n=1 Tax=Mycobacterium marinum TaxID=1781 RepID=UPI00045FD2AA|nr:serine/threonine-protein kinase [Mycobacterium marinum]AXN46847.1 Serine/threonine-protein kinase PknF [Mycobacterium marinum]AXN52276.1 Serine/threonine-protein kinase PknF [Mycobacterium marinum]RFZ06507.1 Serine/threonine-protein kinase PknF [Mycobacterium marinum]RFZ11253.1 Serine/threonine-protein kinase PknF [Mycobacterium marinum]RFZ15093.1 Serine/threonine-protein kinase PknF [Mycobacterium marinum]